MGGNQQRVKLRLFLPPAMSLAANLLPCTFNLSKRDLCVYLCAVITNTNSLNLLNLVSHPMEVLNQQIQCSTYGSTPQFVSHVVHITFRNTGMVFVLPRTRYFDATHMRMHTMVSWCLRAIR